MFRMPVRLFSNVLITFLTLLSFFLFEQASADKSASSVNFREDINGDGSVAIADAVALLLLGRDNPADQRLDYNGDGKYDIIDVVSLIVSISRDNLHQIDLGDAGWQVLGPGSGGSMYLPTIDPFDSSHVLVRCDMTGAYVTTDGGNSWRMFNLRTTIQDFEFDPLSSGTVYASNTGLYRSSDRGLRWQLIYPDPSSIKAEHMVGDHADQWFETSAGQMDRQVEKVRVDPTNSNHIFIALPPPTKVSLPVPPTRVGDTVRVMVSHDRGASWQELPGVQGQEIRALFPGSWWGNPNMVKVITEKSCASVFETGQPTILSLPDTPIVAADGGKGPPGAVIYVLSAMKAQGSVINGGVYRSTDGGGTWESVKDDLIKGWSATRSLPSFETLAACEGRPDVIYLSCSSYTDTGSPWNFGILKSTNRGTNWNWVYRADQNRIISNNFSGSWMLQSYDPSWPANPWSLGVSKANPDICYAADWGQSYRTLNGGAHWEQVSSRNMTDGSYTSRGLDVTSSYGVHLDPLDSQHLFITYTDIGLFHSFNGGASWNHSITGVPAEWINTCYWLVFDPEVKDRLWSVWANCHDLPRPKMMRSGALARGEYQGGVAVSYNGGREWSNSSQGIPSNTVCTHIILDPKSSSSSRTLYVAGFGRGVYKSTDGGLNWVEKSNGLGENRNAWRLTLFPDGTLFLVVVLGLKNGAAVDGALYRSDNGAENWSKVALPSGVRRPNDLVFDPASPDRMYLSAWPWEDESVEPHRDRNGGLYRTEDKGATWKRIFRGDTHVYAAALDPANSSTVIINTFDSAAFRSDDRGETWHRLKGYNFKWGQRPIFDPHHSGMVYLTTFGGSVFYGPAAGVPGAFEDIENLNENWRWSE